MAIIIFYIEHLYYIYVLTIIIVCDMTMLIKVEALERDKRRLLAVECFLWFSSDTFDYNRSFNRIVTMYLVIFQSWVHFYGAYLSYNIYL